MANKESTEEDGAPVEKKSNMLMIIFYLHIE